RERGVAQRPLALRRSHAGANNRAHRGAGMTAQGMVAHDHHLQPEAGRDPPAPRWLWLIAAILPTAAWLLLVRVEAASLFLDWMIYRQGWLLWLSAGTPYQVLAPGWSPCQEFPYLYPPTSWPLLPLSAIVPPVAVGLGVLPL